MINTNVRQFPWQNFPNLLEGALENLNFKQLQFFKYIKRKKSNLYRCEILDDMLH